MKAVTAMSPGQRNFQDVMDLGVTCNINLKNDVLLVSADEI